MGASQIQEYWNRVNLTAREFAELWVQEVPGDDPYDALKMLADLVSRDCRCIPYPWYQDPIIELFKPEVGEPRRKAQADTAQLLQSIATERRRMEQAGSVRLRRDGLVKAFEERGTKAPRFLLPPSLTGEIRRSIQSGEFAASLKKSRAAQLGCDHTPDFRSVLWYKVPLTFSETQSRAIEVLWIAWEDGGLAVSQKVIGEAVDSSSDHFRLRDLFRVPKHPTKMHPAWKTMIHDAGRGMYVLGEPPPKS